MISEHDIPGTHYEWATISDYSAAKQVVLWTAPWKINLMSVDVYFGGTASVSNATLTLYDGTAAIGTASTAGTPAFKTAVPAYSGAWEMTAGDMLSVGCAVGSGTVPSAAVRIGYRGA
jgi:hypothetical protein